MGRKRKPKKKPALTSLLSPEQEDLIRSLIQDTGNIEPSEIISRIPDPHIAQIFIERLPLEKEASVFLLSAIDLGFNEKGVKKAVKRALYRLDKRGVRVEAFYDAREKNFAPPALKRVQREVPVAYLGPVGVRGVRSVLIVMPRAVKGQDAGMGLVSDEEGFLQFVCGGFSRKRVRQMKESLSQDAGPLIETSLSHAATILEEAYGCQPELKSEAPMRYLELRPRLLEETSLLERPVIYDFMTEDSISDEIPTDSRLKRLFDHDLMGSWLIDLERLRPFLEDFMRVEESPIVLSGAQKADRALQIRDKGLEELFSRSRQALLKHRLEEMAYFFSRLGQEEYSGLSLAAARTMDQDVSLKKNRVIGFLFDHSLGFYMDAIRKSAGDDNSGDGSSRGIILPR